MLTQCARALSYGAVFFALFACKLGGEPASCDLREENATCMDVKTRGSVEQTCANLHGKFAKATCQKGDWILLGGCKKSDDMTIWYYFPRTEKSISGAPSNLDGVKEKCTDGKALDPNGNPV
jgi:hypothetical protein